MKDINTFEDTIEIWEKAYKDVAKVCKEYTALKDRFGSSFNDINDMYVSAQNHLLLIKWYKKYGLKLDHCHKPFSYNYFKVGDYSYFSYFSDAIEDKIKGSGKYISWPDDGKQPLNEWLFEISFSTGAYIFGEDYKGQQQLFKDFFNELKSYKPDYIDSSNKNLYWKLKHTKPIFDNFYNILNSYRERNKTELKEREIIKLTEKLETLKNER